jgi:TRAP-type mannitol/chloroaromatic compound transport system permease small subunit
MQKGERFLRYIDSISDWIGKIVSFLILILMGVVLFAVVMRYIVNKPTIWSHETGLYLFGGMVMLGAAYTLRHEGHVRMDAFYGRLSARGRAITDLATFVFFITFVVVLLWKGCDMTWKAIHFMERTESFWSPVIWPSRIVIPVGAFLLLLQGLANFVRDILAVKGGQNS